MKRKEYTELKANTESGKKVKLGLENEVKYKLFWTIQRHLKFYVHTLSTKPCRYQGHIPESSGFDIDKAPSDLISAGNKLLFKSVLDVTSIKDNMSQAETDIISYVGKIDLEMLVEQNIHKFMSRHSVEALEELSKAAEETKQKLTLRHGRMLKFVKAGILTGDMFELEYKSGFPNIETFQKQADDLKERKMAYSKILRTKTDKALKAIEKDIYIASIGNLGEHLFKKITQCGVRDIYSITSYLNLRMCRFMKPNFKIFQWRIKKDIGDFDYPPRNEFDVEIQYKDYSKTIRYFAWSLGKSKTTIYVLLIKQGGSNSQFFDAHQQLKWENSIQNKLEVEAIPRVVEYINYVPSSFNVKEEWKNLRQQIKTKFGFSLY